MKEEMPFQYSICVKVTDDEGNHIEEADITLKHLRNGKNNYPCIYNTTQKYYEFIDLTDIGEYQLWVHKRGDIYKDNQGSVTLNENKIISVHITLEKY